MFLCVKINMQLFYAKEIAMRDKQFLMIPGPTPVPQTALLEMGKAPLGHRSVEFSEILKETYANLKWLFQTKNNVFIFTQRKIKKLIY